MSIKIIVPTTLNSKCVAAARFAAIEAPKAARIAVIVVPILSPNKTGNAPCKVIKSSA